MIIPISEDCRRCKQKHGLYKLYIDTFKKLQNQSQTENHETN
jgi:hypothetical protein